jgi:peptidoglycan hydrolase CwlO-like protein
MAQEVNMNIALQREQMLFQMLYEKNVLISSLQNEVERLRGEIQKLQKEQKGKKQGGEVVEPSENNSQAPGAREDYVKFKTGRKHDDGG